MAGMIDFQSGGLLYALLWFLGFSFLTFNLVYMLIASLYRSFAQAPPLKERELVKWPRTAVVYPVKNEKEGLYERLRYSLQSNSRTVDFWLLSDSDTDHLEDEAQLLSRLREEFGEKAIQYRHREKPVEKKQGNIMEWLHSHPEYEYFFVCDADTLLPEGTLEKMLGKAEHPDNQGIAILQSQLQVVHAKTYFARFQATSARLAQNLYVSVNQTVFGRYVSFGHGCLIRAKAFRELRLPKGIWSHDIWDTVLLDQKGWKTVFCEDAVCFDEVPSHYLELKSRNRRWARGTLQSWPLLFKKGVSAASRFYVFYGIYMYISQPIFFFWILMSFWAASEASGNLLNFQRYSFLGGTLVDIELAGMMIFSLAVVFLHKLVVCKNVRDVWEVIKEIFFSTLICLNNIFYQTMDLILIPFQKTGWIPVKKDPHAGVSLRKDVRVLWPSTLLGFLGLYFGLRESPQWAFGAMPFLISFSFIIPLTYLTSKQAASHAIAR